MDIEPWVVGLVAFVVVTVIVTVVSMFSIRETPFEEAMGSKRRELGLDLALDPTLSAKDGKKQKSQKDKNKDKSSKKVKNADVVKAVKTKNSSEQQEEKRRNSEEEKRRNNSGEEETKSKITTEVKAEEKPSIEITEAPIPVVEVKPSQVIGKSQKNETKKHDRIDFKIANEVVTLNEEEDQKLSERRVSRDDRPRKPILIKKPGGHVEAEHADESKVVRGNSFETVHPKDEFELVKSKQKQSEVDGQVNGKQNGKQNGKVNGHGTVHETVSVSGQGKKKEKRKGENGAEGVQVATSKQLIEMVKSLALSDEEVQVVVNELLNKETGSDWSSKHDPVGHLKRTLAEKEQALAMESCNLEAAQARLREVRQELGSEKTRNSTIHQAAERFRLEVQRQQLLIQQLTERHDVEVKTLQSTLQSKLNEERNLLLAREEMKRLKEVVKKLESERATLDSIPRLKHEMEQLVSERAQNERTMAALKNSADESQRRAVMLDEHLQKLLSDRKQEESAREVQVEELRSQIEMSESKVRSLLQELTSKREEGEGRRMQSEQRMKQLESQLHSLETENTTLKASLSKNGAESSHQLHELNRIQEELRTEIQSKNETIDRLQKELEEEKSSRTSSDSRMESRLNALSRDLDRISLEKEQVSKTVLELETQRNQLNCERDEALNILRPLHLDADPNNLVTLVRCLADQPKGVPGVDLEQLEKEKQALSGQVERFKETLSEKVRVRFD